MQFNFNSIQFNLRIIASNEPLKTEALFFGFTDFLGSSRRMGYFVISFEIFTKHVVEE
jgi:hypothetical protein